MHQLYYQWRHADDLGYPTIVKPINQLAQVVANHKFNETFDKLRSASTKLFIYYWFQSNNYSLDVNHINLPQWEQLHFLSDAGSHTVGKFTSERYQWKGKIKEWFLMVATTFKLLHRQSDQLTELMQTQSTIIVDYLHRFSGLIQSHSWKKWETVSIIWNPKL